MHSQHRAAAEPCAVRPLIPWPTSLTRIPPGALPSRDHIGVSNTGSVEVYWQKSGLDLCLPVQERYPYNATGLCSGSSLTGHLAAYCSSARLKEAEAAAAATSAACRAASGTSACAQSALPWIGVDPAFNNMSYLFDPSVSMRFKTHRFSSQPGLCASDS
jgi:hypothetical protein